MQFFYFFSLFLIINTLKLFDIFIKYLYREMIVKVKKIIRALLTTESTVVIISLLFIIRIFSLA